LGIDKSFGGCYNGGMQKLLNLKDVQKILGVGRIKVYQLIEDKGNPLPIIKMGERIIRVDEEKLKAWLAGVFDNPNNEVADREGGDE